MLHYPKPETILLGWRFSVVRGRIGHLPVRTVMAHMSLIDAVIGLAPGALRMPRASCRAFRG